MPSTQPPTRGSTHSRAWGIRRGWSPKNGLWVRASASCVQEKVSLGVCGRLASMSALRVAIFSRNCRAISCGGHAKDRFELRDGLSDLSPCAPRGDAIGRARMMRTPLRSPVLCLMFGLHLTE